jgi:hypothetical protein
MLGRKSMQTISIFMLRWDWRKQVMVRCGWQATAYSSSKHTIATWILGFA